MEKCPFFDQNHGLTLYKRGLVHGFCSKIGHFSIQDITTSSKSRKIRIFPKGKTHGFGPKMAIFPTFFLQAIQASKMSFLIFQNEKTPLQAIKTKSPKSQKIDICPKGSTHGFGPKMAIFPTFLCRQYRPAKCPF